MLHSTVKNHDYKSLSNIVYSVPMRYCHRLMNNIETKAKGRHLKKLTCKGLGGRCLSEFIDWRYSQSCSYFRPSFVNCCSSNLLSGSTIPPFVWISILVYTLTVWSEWGWGFGFLGLRQINSCSRVSLLVNFYRWWHFALPSMNLIFLRVLLKGIRFHVHHKNTGRGIVWDEG